MASTTRKRAEGLALTKTKVPSIISGSGTVEVEVVPNFAVFIDTHRDQPHVPTFEEDIHRGMSRPTVVHYSPPRATDPPEYMGALIRAEDGREIEVDPKHKFVEVDWWQKFVTDHVIDTGRPPIAMTGEQKGQLPTSHLRDARKRVYHLKTLRQVVRAYEKASTTVTATPYKPKRTGKVRP